MSTIRHQAGTMVAGQKTGGQFKAHERTAAAAPVSAAVSEQQFKEGKAQAWQSVLELSNLAYRARLAESEAQLQFIAFRVKDEVHPDAAFVHLDRDSENPDRLILAFDEDDPATGMGLLLDKDENRLELTEKQRDNLADILYDYNLDEGLIGRDGFGVRGEIRRVELELPDKDDPTLIIDAVGDETLGKIWMERSSRGTLAGAIRTVEETSDEIRDRLLNEYDIEDVDDEMVDDLAAAVVKKHQGGWWEESEYQAYTSGVDEEISKFVAHREANA